MAVRTEAAAGRAGAGRLVALALGIVTAAWIGVHLWQSRGQLATAWRLDLARAGALLALVVAGNWAATALFRRVVGALGLALTFGEAWGLTTATTLLNYAPLNAGLFVRARVLKKHRGFSYTRYLSTMAALGLVHTLASGVLGLAALAWAAARWRGAGPALVVVGLFFALAVAVPLALLHLPESLLARRQGRPARRVRELLAGWAELRAAPSTLPAIAGWALIQLLIVAARLWVCFGALGMEAGFAAALTFAAVAAVATLVNVTPAAIGVRELLVGFLAARFGLDFTHGTAAAGLDRVFVLLFVIPAGIAAVAWLRRRGMIGTPAAAEAQSSGGPGEPGG